MGDLWETREEVELCPADVDLLRGVLHVTCLMHLNRSLDGSSD